MDPISTALTVAWLDAFRRTQTAPPPGPEKPRADFGLTDAIESALRSGGQDSRDPGWTDPAKIPNDPTRPGAVLDVMV